MITIVLNGENKQIEDNTSITGLLNNLDLGEKRLAVELNQEIIPRSDFASYTLNDQDKVEIVQAIGGGQPETMPCNTRDTANKLFSSTSICEKIE